MIIPHCYLLDLTIKQSITRRKYTQMVISLAIISYAIPMRRMTDIDEIISLSFKIWVYLIRIQNTLKQVKLYIFLCLNICYWHFENKFLHLSLETSLLRKRFHWRWTIRYLHKYIKLNISIIVFILFNHSFIFYLFLEFICKTLNRKSIYLKMFLVPHVNLDWVKYL